MGKFIDLTNKEFGYLKVICKDGYVVSKNGSREIMWLCECSCGNQTRVRGGFLRSGHTKSCGCHKTGTNFVDLSNKRFGNIVVLSRHANVLPTEWYCKCDCGSMFVTRGSSLINGHTKSCGCRKKQLRITDMIGRRFERLTVLQQGPDEITKSGLRHIRWICQCDCGRLSLVRGTALRYKHTLSCGCLRNDVLSNTPASYGEVWISEYLSKYGYDYVSQKTYPSLVSDSGKLLSFDFAVKLFDKFTVLIECQGKQHYEPVDYFGGELGYEKQKRNDSLKRTYVDKHKYLFLIELDYSKPVDKDKFIQILDNELQFYLRKFKENIN